MLVMVVAIELTAVLVANNWLPLTALVEFAVYEPFDPTAVTEAQSHGELDRSFKPA